MLYKKLEVLNYKEISDEVYRFVVEKTKILDSADFWNTVNLASFYENNPKIIKYFKTLGLTLGNVAVIHITGKRQLDIHVDGSPGIFMPPRIQWGILNYEGTRTALYEFINPKLKPVVQYTKDAIKSPFLCVIPGTVAEVDSFVLDDGPVVWQPSLPHKVIVENKFPRITLTCSFTESLDFLLEEQ